MNTEAESGRETAKQVRAKILIRWKGARDNIKGKDENAPSLPYPGTLTT